MADTENPQPPESEELALDDLDTGGSPDVDVSGGIKTIAEGKSTYWRPQSNWRGSAPPPRRASADVLKKLAEEKDDEKPAQKVIVATRWLQADDDGNATQKRAEEAIEGEPVWLEVSAKVPDGTPADFVIFQRAQSGGDIVVGDVEADVKDGKAAARWDCVVCRIDWAEGTKDPEVYFKAAVKDDEARSQIIPVESFVELVVVDADGNRVEADVAVTTKHGRELKKSVGKDGEPLRVAIKPGMVDVKVTPKG